MSRRDGACWRHPSRRAAGVCADCLKERLTALSPEPPPPPFTDRSSPFGFLNPHHHPNHTTLIPDSYLRRSKSWSHWEASSSSSSSLVRNNQHHIHHRNHQQLNAFGGRKSDAVLDDWTRQRFFSIFAKDQLQKKRTSEFVKSASGNDRVLTGQLSRPALTSENGRADEECRAGHHVNVNPAASLKSGKAASSSRWWSALLQLVRRQKSKEKKAKGSSSVNWRSVKHTTNNNINNNNNVNLSWISSPLRIFKHGNQQSQQSKKRSKEGVDDHRQQQQQQQQQQEEERSSYSIPSSTEMRRVHNQATTTSNTTAYYRDYGAWSLSSSPVPNNRWSNGGGRGKQPWESRDMVAHSSSSPYHSVGSSTWNFYLTPLRPVKAGGGGSSGIGTSSSKHRK